MVTILGYLAVAFLITSIVGWLWITVMAFSEGETMWGIGCLIISPVCILYGFFNIQELKIPLIMVIAGFLGRVAIALIATSIMA